MNAARVTDVFDLEKSDAYCDSQNANWAQVKVTGCGWDVEKGSGFWARPLHRLGRGFAPLRRKISWNGMPLT